MRRDPEQDEAEQRARNDEASARQAEREAWQADERHVPYEGDILSPMAGLLDTPEGWRARERWYLRQIDQEWDDAEADLHDQPRTRRR